MAALVDTLMSAAGRQFRLTLNKLSVGNLAKSDNSKLVKLEGRTLKKTFPTNHLSDGPVPKKFTSLPLSSFKITVARNASNLLKYNFVANGARSFPKNSFFYQNHLLRRARCGGYLFALGGLVFMKDEILEDIKDEEVELKNYTGLTDLIKNMQASTNFKTADESLEQTSPWRNCKVDASYKQTLAVGEVELNDHENCYEESAFDFESESVEVISYNSQAHDDKEEDSYMEKVLQVEERSDLCLPLKQAPMISKGEFNSVAILKWSNVGRIGRHPNVATIERAQVQRHHRSSSSTRPVKCDGEMRFTFQFVEPTLVRIVLTTKKYDTNLEAMMREEWFTRDDHVIAVIISQMLEAVAFIRSQLVAHRSITPGCMYVQLNQDDYPRVCLGDFMHAMQANDESGMLVPFEDLSFDTRPPYNQWQAPEIFSAKYGKGRGVDYGKSDVWSVGVITSQLLDSHFRSSTNSQSRADNENRGFFNSLTAALLNPDLKSRLSANEAADVMHLRLFSRNHRLDCDLYSSLASWLTLHYVESRLRPNGCVLTDLTTSFLTRLDAPRLARAALMCCT